MANSLAVTKAIQNETTRSFTAKIQAAKYLSAEEEASLARNFAENGCLASKEKLICAHLRQVLKMAAMLSRSTSMDMDDLMQEGALGLDRAVKKFEVDKGFRFSTYASQWINSFMGEYIMRNRSVIRIPHHKKNKTIIMMLNRQRAQIAEGMSEEVFEEIAEKTEASVEHVRLIYLIGYGLQSLNSRTDSENEESNEIGDFVADEGPQPDEIVEAQDELTVRRKLLETAMDECLTERERVIIRHRRLVDQDDIQTLEELANQFNITRERVRQIEVKAFDKISAHIHSAASAKQASLQVMGKKAETPKIAVNALPKKLPPLIAGQKAWGVRQKKDGAAELVLREHHGSWQYKQSGSEARLVYA